MGRLLLNRFTSIIVVSVIVVFMVYLGMYLMIQMDQGQLSTSARLTSTWIDTIEPADKSYHFVENSLQAMADTRTFFGNLLRGDLGMIETQSIPRPVSDVVQETFLRSAGLLALALLLATAVGLLIGTLAALAKQGQWVGFLLTLTILGISAPSFLVAVLLQQGGILYTQNVGRQLVSMGGYGWDFKHLAMPLIVLAARPIAYLTRSVYIALTRIMTEDYIRTAYAKGVSRNRAVATHAFKNLAVPFITAVGLSLRFSLSTLPIVEYIFGWPGIGNALLEAINDRTLLLAATITFVIGLTFQLINLALDIIYRMVDPRLRS